MTEKNSKMLKTIFSCVALVLAIATLGLMAGDYSMIVSGGVSQSYGLKFIIEQFKLSLEEFKQGGEHISNGINIGLPIYVLLAIMVFTAVSMIGGIIISSISIAKAGKDEEDTKWVSRSLVSVGFGALAHAGALLFMYGQIAVAGEFVTLLGYGGIAILACGVIAVGLLCASTFLFEKKSALVRSLKTALVGVTAILSVTLLFGEIIAPVKFNGMENKVMTICTPYNSFLDSIRYLIVSRGQMGPQETKTMIVVMVSVFAVAISTGAVKAIVDHSFSLRVNKRNEAKAHPYVGAIVASAIAIILYVGGVVTFVVANKQVGYPIEFSAVSFVNFVLLAAALGLSIALLVLDKKEEAPINEATYRNEPVVNVVLDENGNNTTETTEEVEEEQTKAEVVAAAVVASEMVEEEPKAEEPVEEPKEEVFIEQQVAEEPVEEKPVEEPVKEEAPKAEKKAPAKKAAPSKKAAPAKKEPAKKEAAKAPAKKAEDKGEKKEVNFRTYHLVKREDGKWEVKYAGGQKAIKLFDTQKEALEYSKKMAENQGGKVLVHNSKGENKGRIQKKR